MLKIHLYLCAFSFEFHLVDADNRKGEGWCEELQKQREALKALEREEFLRFGESWPPLIMT